MSVGRHDRLMLVLFGCFCGVALAGVLYFFFGDRIQSLLLPAGARFESLDDLRGAMLHQEADDGKPARSVPFRAIVQPHPSDRIIYELRPGFSGRFQRVAVEINAHGMRGPETTILKPAGTYRVALLGDSFAFGWGVEQDKIFAAVLQQKLQVAAPEGLKVEVLNFGVPGYSTFQEVEQFFLKGYRFEPDLVLVYFIENDFGLPFYVRDLSGQYSLIPVEFARGASRPKGDDQGKDKKAKLADVINPNKALLRLARYCREKEIPVYLAIQPHRQEDKTRRRLWVLQKHSNLINEIPMREPFRAALDRGDQPAESLRLQGDPHPGPGGHAIIGTILAEGLLQGQLW